MHCPSVCLSRKGRMERTISGLVSVDSSFVVLQSYPVHKVQMPVGIVYWITHLIAFY